MGRGRGRGPRRQGRRTDPNERTTEGRETRKARLREWSSEQLEASPDEERPPAFVEYELEFPVQFLGEPLWTVRLYRPRFGDVKDLEDLPETEVTEVLLERLSQPKLEGDTIDQLDLVDAQGLAEVIAGFRMSSPRRGKSESD